MALQLLSTLRRPLTGLSAFIIALIFLFTFLYFDFFLFLSPYVTFYAPPDRAGLLLLDASISVLSGMVIALSAYQIKNVPRGTKNQGRLGVAGVFAALLAGACPCYYLVPLLAAAGGAGGILGALGIAFNAYELPVKLGSLALLGFVTFGLERSLRASCDINPST